MQEIITWAKQLSFRVSVQPELATLSERSVFSSDLIFFNCSLGRSELCSLICLDDRVRSIGSISREFRGELRCCGEVDRRSEEFCGICLSASTGSVLSTDLA
ncbi:hypothetical protein VNO78_30873 [Psophocarpus tetragonolobus]|uniref:Uncharacterized protein n=1 Tax=Psophocarpus tetragonolobus TaxID=3891 RepID=A0AAN9RXM8_PSOTE